MANTTKLLRCGTGESFPIDTELSSTGVYPVEGKGIKAYVDTEIAKPKTAIYFSANNKTYVVSVNSSGKLACAEYTPPEPETEE